LDVIQDIFVKIFVRMRLYARPAILEYVMEALFIYMTAGSVEEARSIARILVEERLAACVNIIGGMHSVYRWQDGIEEASEVVMIAKTSSDGFDALAARVRDLHSYDTPCIVALPLTAGDPRYLDWIRASSG
jgi:periplasmic divalent cation tolerance protein